MYMYVAVAVAVTAVLLLFFVSTFLAVGVLTVTMVRREGVACSAR